MQEEKSSRKEKGIKVVDRVKEDRIEKNKEETKNVMTISVLLSALLIVLRSALVRVIRSPNLHRCHWNHGHAWEVSQTALCSHFQLPRRTCTLS